MATDQPEPTGDDPKEDVELRLKVTWKLEKFDGDMKPGDTPVEVIEGEFPQCSPK